MRESRVRGGVGMLVRKVEKGRKRGEASVSLVWQGREKSSRVGRRLA